jgi:DNA repair protein RadA/Sms
MLLALYSSFQDRPLQSRMICFGEIGLSGEVRPVPDGEQRLREAAGHGFTAAIVPVANAPRKPLEGLSIVTVRSIAEVLERIA